MQEGSEGVVLKFPTPDELWNMTFATAKAWRDRFAAVSFEDKGGSHPSRYYQETAVEPGVGKLSLKSDCAFFANARHRHRQDIHRVSDRVEAVSKPLESERRADAAATHPLSGRP